MRLFLLLIAFVLMSVPGQAQSNPEVYLGTISFDNETFTITELQNISNSPGYDNQPSFHPNGRHLFYVSTRGDANQDILSFDIKTGAKAWITDLEGGEYSPTVTPDPLYLSSIWLKPDGEQLLWKFPIDGGKPKVVVPDEVIGYHTWFDKKTLYTFVLGDPQTFVEFKIGRKGSRKVIANNPGRSIHKIPGKELISFIDKSNPDSWLVKYYDPTEELIASITETPEGSEDMFWVDGEHFLIGTGNALRLWKEGHGYTPEVKVFDREGTISRIALNPDRTKIAIVFAETD